ncbi:MAG: hypothetical protein ACPGRX_00295 [Bdellovibrionales bacterium]
MTDQYVGKTYSELFAIAAAGLEGVEVPENALSHMSTTALYVHAEENYGDLEQCPQDVTAPFKERLGNSRDEKVLDHIVNFVMEHKEMSGGEDALYRAFCCAIADEMDEYLAANPEQQTGLFSDRGSRVSVSRTVLEASRDATRHLVSTLG